VSSARGARRGSMAEAVSAKLRAAREGFSGVVLREGDSPHPNA